MRVWWMQHAVGYVTGDQFYGAKASLNVWSAKVASPAEFSLSQIWVISGSFGNDLNTIEAGWQVGHCPSKCICALPYLLALGLLNLNEELPQNYFCTFPGLKMWPSDRQCLRFFF
jgi:hypothetical protein